MAEQSTAEELVAQELNVALGDLMDILKPFCHTSVTAELLLLLGAGVMFGAYSVKEVCIRMGLSPTMGYYQLQFQSVYRWRKLICEMGYAVAIPLLQDLQRKSASTNSRACCVLAVDDTVLQRLSQQLGLVWQWYTGVMKMSLLSARNVDPV